jgi:hypothetical protein
MEPHCEEQPEALEPSATLKPKRFRIVKLEERIAPGHKYTANGPTCGPYPDTYACYTTWNACNW